jgi:hypothetical protein
MLMAVGGFHVYYAQEVRPYALIALVTALQLYCYAGLPRMATSTTSRPLLAFAAASCVATLTSLFQFFLLAALAISELVVWGLAGRVSASQAGGVAFGRAWLLRWSVCGLFCLPALAFYLLLGPSAGETGVPRGFSEPLANLLFSIFGMVFGTTLAPPLSELRGPGRIDALMSQWPLLLLAALAAGGLVLFVVVGLKRWLAGLATVSASASSTGKTDSSPDRQTQGWVLSLAALLSLALFLVFTVATGFQWLPRHSMYVSLLLLLAMAFHLDAMWSDYRKLAVAVTVAVVLLNGVALARYFFDDRYLKDDYRAVGHFLAAEPQTPALMVWGWLPLLERYGAPDLSGYEDLSPADTLIQLRSLVAPGEQVFLVVNRRYYWTDLPISEVAPGFVIEERTAFQEFEVYRLRKRELIPEASEDGAEAGVS